jgi:hypothetical protein
MFARSRLPHPSTGSGRGLAIDFVVEGADDRRLAIELDGDKYHGPDRWADDVRRQKSLERLGWTFWRCWGSAWISDRESCFADLMDTFRRLGIEPIGAGETEGDFTAHIEVRLPTDAEPTTGESVGAAPTGAFGHDQTVPKGRSRQRARIAVQGTLPLGFAERQSDESASNDSQPTAEPIGEDVISRLRAGLVSVPSVDPQTQGLGGVFADLDSNVIEVGDLVFIRYDDESDRPLSVRLSSTENNPDNGIVHVDQPLGTAILGASLDEQITVKIGNRIRIAVIEKIEKPRLAQAMAAD